MSTDLETDFSTLIEHDVSRNPAYDMPRGECDKCPQPSSSGQEGTT
jgi:hypothetical protein